MPLRLCEKPFKPMKFTEAQLEKAVITLFKKEKFTYVKGEQVKLYDG